MIDTLTFLSIKDKAVRVINSCETRRHAHAAKRYVELYRIKTEDMLGYYQLKRLLNEKEELIK